MRLRTAAMTAIVAVLMSPRPSFAQTASPSQQPTSTSVPRLVTISGTYRAAAGQKAAGGERIEVVTLAIYADETGGEPLWQETQNVVVDASGKYSLLLGATTEGGIPLEVFATGQARWLGMVWSWPGEADAARVRLTSVPYALRASDAATLGGKPASAYQLAPSAGGQTTAGAVEEGITTQAVLPGTTNVLAKYVNGVDVGNSAVYESAGFVGVNTTNPFDIIHARFSNSNGGLTGIAVQNLDNTAASYSGMLFYDHTGALGQFQGFNNSTHEYRINNIASGGSINFMLNSISRLKIEAGGNIGIGIADPTQKLEVSGAIWANGGDLRALGSQTDGLRWVDTNGLVMAHIFRYGAVNDRLYFSNNGSGNLTGLYIADGAVTFTSTSDERLKTDIEPITGILDKIKDIRVVGFNMASLSIDEKSKKPVVNPDIKKRTMNNGTVIKQQIGSIAQDWLKNFPELVVEPQADDDYYGLDYDRIGVVALGAVKELNALVSQKDEEIKALTARLAALEQLVQQFTGQMEKPSKPKQ